MNANVKTALPYRVWLWKNKHIACIPNSIAIAIIVLNPARGGPSTSVRLKLIARRFFFWYGGWIKGRVGR